MTFASTNRERLYKIEHVIDDEQDAPLPTEEEGDPEGWAAYCQEAWGEYKPFFFPSTKRVYRSRSAAVERAATINRWGGSAIVLECTPDWRTLETASRERALARSHNRIQALRSKIARERERFDLIADASIETGQREIKRRTDVDEHLQALDG